MSPHETTSSDENASARSLQLIQLLLPLYDNQRRPFRKELFDAMRRELTDRFGGVTLFVRSPAVGVWEDEDGDVCRDDVVLVEVMAESLEPAWWAAYRKELEARFDQDEIMIRAIAMQRL